MGEYSDRRCFPRVPCSGAAEIVREGQRWGWGTLTDVSRGGCYIETNQPLPLGAEAHLRLTIADISLDIDAKAASITPMMGMGMGFIAISQEQKIKLAWIIEKVTATQPSPVLQKAVSPEPSRAAVRIAREAAPNILAKIIERVNEKGAVTRQELIEIVKSNNNGTPRP
jgi:hypothetical protein